MAFILTDAEYETAKKNAWRLSSQLVKKSKQYKKGGVGRKERRRLMHSEIRNFKTLKRNIAVYENLTAGKLPKNFELASLGRQLVLLRIAGGLSQVDLAAQLSEEARKIDSDERTDYQHATVSYAQRVLSALKAKVRCTMPVKR